MSAVEFFIIIGISVSLLLLSFIIYFLFIHQRRQFAFRQEKQELNAAFQQTLLRTQLEIQEHTFKTISEEIHDNIGQMLIVVKLNLNTLSNNLPEHDRQKIENAREILSKTIHELRDLSKSLNTETISKTGLLKAIETELKTLQKTGTIEPHFVEQGEPFSLDPEKELILFRIVQEALHNIIKHANASTVEVSMTFADRNLQLQIQDNGIGFESKDKLTLGSGLSNMQSRARIIGATMQLQSERDKGTVITIDVPKPA